MFAVYSATKAFVLSFTEALWEEARGTGVNVSCLCPGPTESGFHKRAGTERFAAGSRGHDVRGACRRAWLPRLSGKPARQGRGRGERHHGRHGPVHAARDGASGCAPVAPHLSCGRCPPNGMLPRGYGNRNCAWLPPHPVPLPRGEGNAGSAGTAGLPLPLGRGRGRGVFAAFTGVVPEGRGLHAFRDR